MASSFSKDHAPSGRAIIPNRLPPNFRQAAGLRRVYRCGVPSSDENYYRLLRNPSRLLLLPCQEPALSCGGESEPPPIAAAAVSAPSDVFADDEENGTDATTAKVTASTAAATLIVDLRSSGERSATEEGCTSNDDVLANSNCDDDDGTLRIERVDLIRTVIRSLVAAAVSEKEEDIMSNSATGKEDVVQPLVEAINRDGLSAFYRVLIDHASRDICRILKVATEHLEQHDTADVVIHCAHGKDRTGVIVMLLQAAAGVDGGEDDDDLIVRDYAESRDTLTKEMIAATNGVEMAKGVNMDVMGSADPSNMEETLRWIRERHGGSIHSYLDKIGFDHEWRTRFQNTQ